MNVGSARVEYRSDGAVDTALVSTARELVRRWNEVGTKWERSVRYPDLAEKVLVNAVEIQSATCWRYWQQTVALDEGEFIEEPLSPQQHPVSTAGDISATLRSLPDRSAEYPLEDNDQSTVIWSVKTATCSQCRGRCEVICHKCRRKGSVVCPECTLGIVTTTQYTTITCSNCGGDGRIWTGRPCLSCDGGGTTKTTDGKSAYCTDCDGHGKQLGDCLRCEGKGTFSQRDEVRSKCSNCRGDGTLKCTLCGGEGMLTCRTCEGKGKVQNVEHRRRTFTCVQLDEWVTGTDLIDGGAIRAAGVFETAVNSDVPPWREEHGPESSRGSQLLRDMRRGGEGAVNVFVGQRWKTTVTVAQFSLGAASYQLADIGESRSHLLDFGVSAPADPALVSRRSRLTAAAAATAVLTIIGLGIAIWLGLPLWAVIAVALAMGSSPWLLMLGLRRRRSVSASQLSVSPSDFTEAAKPN